MKGTKHTNDKIIFNEYVKKMNIHFFVKVLLHYTNTPHKSCRTRVLNRVASTLIMPVYLG